MSLPAFEKKSFGGYDPIQVDQKIAELNKKIQLQQNEKRDLKSQIAFLTKTIDDLRYQMAQTASNSDIAEAESKSREMIEKANKKCVAIVDSAKSIASNQISLFRNEIVRQEKRVTLVQEKTDAFLDRIIAAYTNEITALKRIKNVTAGKPEFDSGIISDRVKDILENKEPYDFEEKTGIKAESALNEIDVSDIQKAIEVTEEKVIPETKTLSFGKVRARKF